jgi:hypothetical protein
MRNVYLVWKGISDLLQHIERLGLGKQHKLYFTQCMRGSGSDCGRRRRRWNCDIGTNFSAGFYKSAFFGWRQWSHMQ